MNLPLVYLAALLAMGNPERTDEPSEKKKGDTAEVGEFTGYYTCKGAEMNGKTYSGICVISKQKEVYVVNWVIGNGSTFSGIGIRQGNNLAISWTLPNDRGGVIRGINLYRIEAGPRLVGKWAAIPGPGVMASETLQFLKHLEPEEH